MLHVTWSNNSVNRYPFMYLRDNCRCPECFHESSLQRSFDTVGKLDPKILPEKYEVRQDGEKIIISWPDGHVSVFDSDWLHTRRLSDGEGSRSERSTLNREGVEFWNAEKLQGKIPKSDFRELMGDDRALFEWLNSLHGVGIALVTNTPQKVGQAEKLCDRVGHSKTTHYGHSFEVRTMPVANNLAYTSKFLPLHTDQPYVDYTPGTLLLHCVEQAPGTGGANQFVDGFHVARELQNKHPEMFDLLTKARFQFVDVGKDVFGEFHQKCSHNTIELDENNQIVRFAFNNHVRDSIMLTASPEETAQLYKAYLTLGKMLRDPANQIEHKMMPGDMLCTNNSRVLHGRSEFTVTGKQTRFLIGIHMDWDIMYSRMRVLARKLNIPFHG
ncbi:hypothetical protein ACROYT_G002690 [Oculina patagonica]